MCETLCDTLHQAIRSGNTHILETVQTLIGQLQLLIPNTPLCSTTSHCPLSRAILDSSIIIKEKNCDDPDGNTTLSNDNNGLDEDSDCTNNGESDIDHDGTENNGTGDSSDHTNDGDSDEYSSVGDDTDDEGFSVETDETGQSVDECDIQKIKITPELQKRLSDMRVIANEKSMLDKLIRGFDEALSENQVLANVLKSFSGRTTSTTGFLFVWAGSVWLYNEWLEFVKTKLEWDKNNQTRARAYKGFAEKIGVVSSAKLRVSIKLGDHFSALGPAALLFYKSYTQLVKTDVKSLIELCDTGWDATCIVGSKATQSDINAFKPKLNAFKATADAALLAFKNKLAGNEQGPIREGLEKYVLENESLPHPGQKRKNEQSQNRFSKRTLEVHERRGIQRRRVLTPPTVSNVLQQTSLANNENFLFGQAQSVAPLDLGRWEEPTGSANLNPFRLTEWGVPMRMNNHPFDITDWGVTVGPTGFPPFPIDNSAGSCATFPAASLQLSEPQVVANREWYQLVVLQPSQFGDLSRNSQETLTMSGSQTSHVRVY